MRVILIPGLWLDGASWGEVVPRLQAAGHDVVTLTLPGMESKDADRSGITRRDYVEAIVAAIDAADGPVVLVGHSIGASWAHAAVDARPDSVARAIYVGGFPSPDGAEESFPSSDGEIPLFDWDDFDDADLRDLDDEARAEFRSRAISTPAGAANDPQELSDPRRYDVPVTMICPEFDVETLQGWMAQGLEPVTELARISEVTYVDLPTGHWPQFTKPERLAEVIAEAIDSIS